MHLLIAHCLKLALTLLPVMAWLMPAPGAAPSARLADPATQEVREVVNKTITLAPGSQVRLNGLNGRVKIETWNGNQAEIHITITASDRAAFDRKPLFVEDTGNSLTIRTEEERDRERGWRDRDRGYVRHETLLRLPSNINLDVNGINGGLDVGQITGTVGVNGINGSVNIAQAGRATTLTGINGRVSVSLASLGEDGLRINGINGGVELRIPANTNAELDVTGTSGGVDSELQMMTTGTLRHGELRGTIGSGGPRINVNGVNGSIHIKRL